MDKLKFSPIPINMVAVKTMFYKGEEYIPSKKILTNDSIVPIDIKPLHQCCNNMENLTGIKFGRFIVIGKAKNHKGWVVKCACGRYTTRRAKSIKNPNNTQDRCERCRQLAFIKRERFYKVNGFDKDIKEY